MPRRCGSTSIGRSLQVDAFKLVGDDTELDLSGSVDLRDQSLALQANGAANLAVLQGFVADLRSSGRAEVSARISGTATEPVVSGNALLADGRLRQLSFPHALENLNGIVTFDASGIRVDGVTARLGGGPIKFGGRIGLFGYRLSEFDLTATGEEMRLRYPEGMRSLVDGTLTLQGPAEAPVIGGTLTVRSATWTRAFDDVRQPVQRPHRRRGAAAEHRRPGRGRIGLAAALRHPRGGAVHAADRQRDRAHHRERGPHAARHVRSAAAVRPRRHRVAATSSSRAAGIW